MRLFHTLLLPLCLLFAQVGPGELGTRGTLPGSGEQLWFGLSGHQPQAEGTDPRQRAQTSGRGHRPQAQGIDLRQRAQTPGSWHRPQTEGTAFCMSSPRGQWGHSSWEGTVSAVLWEGLCVLCHQVSCSHVGCAGLLASLIPRSPKCAHLGGSCYLSHCPEGTREDGSCYRARASKTITATITAIAV
ncbi:hypothetical protein QTO34_016442 [Cnephaeus nilssonii]|uniref:Uncharacterized protein n=1 Tax=Cnephaeus nilssonii TaxID=3371016 RepID=A0AA40I2C5_CNENI|nr:hypothetical protein QTO34_016442 [Eptesicus nilssonii]